MLWSQNEHDSRSPQAYSVFAGDTLTQSVVYVPANNSYTMYIASARSGKSILWNYKLEAKQGDTPESTAYIVVEHQPESCDMFPMNGNITFSSIVIEVEGETVAFMLTFPDMNAVIKPFGGRLGPLRALKLLRWLRRPKAERMRVPLMGVVKKLQSSRLASQLAFMMIEYIRRDAVRDYGARSAEIGWILDDNQGMRAIADAIESKVNREYAIYGKNL